PAVEREDLLEREARALGDASHLLEHLGVVPLDVRHPRRRTAADVVPREARLALELALVEVDRDGDLVARLLAVLAAPLAGLGGVDLDQRQHQHASVASTT